MKSSLAALALAVGLLTTFPAAAGSEACTEFCGKCEARCKEKDKKCRDKCWKEAELCCAEYSLKKGDGKSCACAGK